MAGVGWLTDSPGSLARDPQLHALRQQQDAAAVAGNGGGCGGDPAAGVARAQTTAELELAAVLRQMEDMRENLARRHQQPPAVPAPPPPPVVAKLPTGPSRVAEGQGQQTRAVASSTPAILVGVSPKRAAADALVAELNKRNLATSAVKRLGGGDGGPLRGPATPLGTPETEGHAGEWWWPEDLDAAVGSPVAAFPGSEAGSSPGRQLEHDALWDGDDSSFTTVRPNVVLHAHVVWHPTAGLPKGHSAPSAPSTKHRHQPSSLQCPLSTTPPRMSAHRWRRRNPGPPAKQRPRARAAAPRCPIAGLPPLATAAEAAGRAKAGGATAGGAKAGGAKAGGGPSAFWMRMRSRSSGRWTSRRRRRANLAVDKSPFGSRWMRAVAASATSRLPVVLAAVAVESQSSERTVELIHWVESQWQNCWRWWESVRGSGGGTEAGSALGMCWRRWCRQWRLEPGCSSGPVLGRDGRVAVLVCCNLWWPPPSVCVGKITTCIRTIDELPLEHRSTRIVILSHRYISACAGAASTGAGGAAAGGAAAGGAAAGAAAFSGERCRSSVARAASPPAATDSAAAGSGAGAAAGPFLHRPKRPLAAANPPASAAPASEPCAALNSPAVAAAAAAARTKSGSTMVVPAFVGGEMSRGAHRCWRSREPAAVLPSPSVLAVARLSPAQPNQPPVFNDGARNTSEQRHSSGHAETRSARADRRSCASCRS